MLLDPQNMGLDTLIVELYALLAEHGEIYIFQ